MDFILSQAYYNRNTNAYAVDVDFGAKKGQVMAAQGVFDRIEPKKHVPRVEAALQAKVAELGPEEVERQLTTEPGLQLTYSDLSSGPG